jgi:hypothetical protein
MDSQALLDLVRASPKDAGVLKFIVLRLPNEQRQTPSQAILSVEHGVGGDRWGLKTNPNPLMQVSVMNSRFLGAISVGSEHMTLAGDNLIVDLDLHEDNVPPGTRLRIGDVVLEVTDVPHTGCSKFERRYGKAALDLTNTPEGSAMHLRGVLARVIHGGEVRLGDTIRKEASHA